MNLLAIGITATLLVSVLLYLGHLAGYQEGYRAAVEDERKRRGSRCKDCLQAVWPE